MPLRPRVQAAGRTTPDGLRFIRSWMSDPLRVAAVAPSSAALARLITREIDVSHAPILELGPGTGVFTQALIARGIAQKDLTILELGDEFVTLLRDRFPEANILHGNAARLLRQPLFQDEKAGAAISGLGLLSMSPRAVLSIVGGAFANMRPDASFYQFTYGPQCPIHRSIMERLHLKAERVGGTFRNVPPAAVYRISRQS